MICRYDMPVITIHSSFPARSLGASPLLKSDLACSIVRLHNLGFYPPKTCTFVISTFSAVLSSDIRCRDMPIYPLNEDGNIFSCTSSSPRCPSQLLLTKFPFHQRRGRLNTPEHAYLHRTSATVFLFRRFFLSSQMAPQNRWSSYYLLLN
jgi:hypothetical protein